MEKTNEEGKHKPLASVQDIICNSSNMQEVLFNENNQIRDESNIDGYIEQLLDEK